MSRVSNGRGLARRPELDGLRGVAVALVVASHAVPSVYIGGGLVGVAMFFSLSGYLITRILLAEHAENGSVDLVEFYGRRAVRLLPALVVFLAFLLAAGRWVGGLATPIQAAAVLAYLGNIPKLFEWRMGALAHTWSLAIEEQFYIVFPGLLIIAMASRASRRWLPLLLLGAALISIAVRVGYWVGGASGPRVYFATETNAGLLLLGCAAAVLVTRRPRMEVASPRLVTALLVAAAAAPVLVADGAAARTWLPILGAVVGTSAMLFGRTAAWLRHPALTYLGLRSYGLYLWHFPLLWVLLPRVQLAPWLAVPAMVMAAVLMAELSWRLVEQPCQRWAAQQRWHGGRAAGRTSTLVS